VQRELQATQAYLEGLAHTIREPFLILDGDLRIIRASQSFYERFHENAASTEGQRIYDLGNRQWDIPALRQMLEDVLPEQSVLSGFEVQHEFPTIGRRNMRLNAHRLEHGGDPSELIFLAIEDVTDKC
jgi:PAS domain-containing protein